MFFRNKNNKKVEILNIEKRIVLNNSFKTDYVEIRELSKDFAQLTQFAHNINDIGKEVVDGNVNMFFYQKSIKQAFVEEFEQRLEALFGKKLSFAEYWKTRSC